MPTFKVMVTIPHASAAVADQVVNNWAVEGLGDAASTEALLTPVLKAFYDSWATYRSTAMLWTGARSKGYDMADALPRAPQWDTSLGLSASKGTSALPHEVALCLSFQRARASGVNMRRGRGRVYLGPFASVAHDSGQGRPELTLRNLLRTSAQALLDASSTSPGWEWAIISNATGAPSSSIVHDGWIDDAWDTQRRRGIPPTSRVVFSKAP